jgi:hypothetical protein
MLVALSICKLKPTADEVTHVPFTASAIIDALKPLHPIHHLQLLVMFAEEVSLATSLANIPFVSPQVSHLKISNKQLLIDTFAHISPPQKYQHSQHHINRDVVL